MKKKKFWLFVAGLLALTVLFCFLAIPIYVWIGLFLLITFLYGLWKEFISRWRKNKKHSPI